MALFEIIFDIIMFPFNLLDRLGRSIFDDPIDTVEKEEEPVTCRECGSKSTVRREGSYSYQSSDGGGVHTIPCTYDLCLRCGWDNCPDNC